ncbi:MAG: prolyl oligopeptidase family serine peptidase [Acidobacteriota bacterium]
MGRPTLAAAADETGGIDTVQTRREDHVDVYHGVEVADPYRWLEADVRESEEVRRWVEAQNEVTFGYLASIPERPAIEERLRELWNFERYSVPEKDGGRYVFTKNDGLQDQAVLYVQDSLEAEPRVLLDPNAWSDDGTVALAGVSVSDGGRYLAYAVAESGSDWTTWRVMEIETGRVLPETIRWIKFSGVEWGPKEEGFFYGRYPRPEEGTEYQSVALNQKVYFHRVGTPQEEDVLVYERPDLPELSLAARVTDDERYLVLLASKGTSGNAVLVRDLEQPYAMPHVLVGELEHQRHDYDFVGNEGERLFFRTDDGAPRYRLIAIDLRRPGREHWSTVIPEADETLERVSHVGGRFIARYLEDAKSMVRVFTVGGEAVRDVDLPGIGTAAGFGGRPDDPETFYVFSSFATPPSIYRYDVATGESTLLRRADVDFDPDLYTVEQVFFRSKDGTRVPMFVAHKKGLELDGSNPTLLYGYGGFQISLTPYFSVSRLAWMEMGGVFAMANLRGGGEYGEGWHEAGIKLRKQNVFDDFIAAAEWLVGHGYTRPDKLAIQGGSNGGLLVGAAMTQRPDLFGAALPAVGVMDMLRFDQFTAGRFWVDDYGSAEDPEEFEALYAYSPYHNLEPGTSYPATLVTTADTDDRVVPAHSFKFAARLQHAHAGTAPVLIRIETRAGHGGGTPTSKLIERVADEWAFLIDILGMDPAL